MLRIALRRIASTRWTFPSRCEWSSTTLSLSTLSLFCSSQYESLAECAFFFARSSLLRGLPLHSRSISPWDISIRLQESHIRSRAGSTSDRWNFIFKAQHQQISLKQHISPLEDPARPRYSSQASRSILLIEPISLQISALALILPGFLLQLHQVNMPGPN